MLSDRIFEGGAAIREFLSDVGLALEREVGMSECVISGDVPSLHDFARELGSLANVTANEKKSGVHIVFGKNVEQF